MQNKLIFNQVVDVARY